MYIKFKGMNLYGKIISSIHIYSALSDEFSSATVLCIDGSIVEDVTIEMFDYISKEEFETAEVLYS